MQPPWLSYVLQSGKREETICPTPGLGSCWNTLGLHSFGSQPWWSSRAFQKFPYRWKTYGWARFCITSLSPYHLPAGPGVPGLACFTSASPHHWSAVIHCCSSADRRPVPNSKSAAWATIKSTTVIHFFRFVSHFKQKAWQRDLKRHRLEVVLISDLF